MFVIEFIQKHLLSGVDDGDAPWQRYQHHPYRTIEQADSEALWLSQDDHQYVYRVVELVEAA
jgi:hypothetical protein